MRRSICDLRAHRMTIARSIDDVMAAFEAGGMGSGAEEWELDALATWPWPTGFVPTTDDLTTILQALRVPGGLLNHRETLPARPIAGRQAAKVAG